MNTFTWSLLATGQQIVFNPTTDKIVFDTPATTWGDIGKTGNWGWNLSGQTFFLSYQGKRVEFLGLPANEFASDTLTFASGAQTLLGDGLTSNLNDNAGNTITGSLFGDLLMGLGGNDSLSGSQGNDLLYGNSGNDTLDGGDGIDTAYYAQGDPTPITADLRTGTATQGIHTDTLRNIEGLRGGAGNDQLTGNDENNRLFGNDGNDTLTGMAGSDWLLGGAGADKLRGGGGNDAMNGGSGHDVLFGGLGNDSLTGGAGNDFLSGGDGKDILTGGVGQDMLTGGAGQDQFRFAHMNDFARGPVSDEINDFSQGDLIDLSGIDANTTVIDDQAFTFVAGGPFPGVFTQTGELFFDQTTGTLYGNNDADAGSDFSIQINLVGVTTLTASDFKL